MKILKAVVGIVVGAFVGFAVATLVFAGYYVAMGRVPLDSTQAQAILMPVTLSASLVGAVIGGILGVKRWWQTLVASVVVILASRKIASYIVLGEWFSSTPTTL